MRLLILLFITSLSFGQINKLRPEFRNLSWIMDDKAAEVVNTLSKHYGNSIFIKKDSVFVTQDNYELYQDSAMLYKLTKGVFKEKNSKAKSTIIGPFTDSKERHSVAEWIKIFDKETRRTYAANKNSTVGNYGCLPSTYENLKFFYAKEKESIKSYNNGRIKVYDTKSLSSSDTINFFVAFHKTIQPIETGAVYYYDGWIPYVYFYAKPKQIVYPATIQKIWEIKTGLPYTTAQKLELSDERIVKILSMPVKTNDKVLEELPINKEYDIAVNCDTCNIKLFDNHSEDNDIIDFTYKNQTEEVTIKNAGVDYKVIIDQDNSFYIFAVSEGFEETCTIDALINGQNHIFALRKGERVLIKLHKI